MFFMNPKVWSHRRQETLQDSHQWTHIVRGYVVGTEGKMEFEAVVTFQGSFLYEGNTTDHCISIWCGPRPIRIFRERTLNVTVLKSAEASHYWNNARILVPVMICSGLTPCPPAVSTLGHAAII